MFLHKEVHFLKTFRVKNANQYQLLALVWTFYSKNA